MRNCRRKLMCCCFFAVVSAAWSAQFPKTAGESLAGQQLVLPDSLKGHTAVIVVGFSKSSQNEVKEWDNRARKQLDGIEVYQVAVLEDAPSFIRGMIKHAMKGSMPADRQSRFMIVIKGEAELKKAADFSATGDAYVFLLDGNGEIRWRTHGAVTDPSLNELSNRIRGLK